MSSEGLETRVRSVVGAGRAFISVELVFVSDRSIHRGSPRDFSLEKTTPLGVFSKYFIVDRKKLPQSALKQKLQAASSLEERRIKQLVSRKRRKKDRPW